MAAIVDNAGMAIQMYGIPNCDTVKKARAWLDEQGMAYTFHDFKKAGADPAVLQAALRDVPWDKLINRQGTSWRKLTAEQQAAVVDGESAVAAAVANPSLVKRPLVRWAHEGWTVGFDAKRWSERID